MLTDRDRQRLAGVHSDLVRLVNAADEAGAKFAVIEGVRTIERQRKLFAEGATKTLNSRHLTGHAVDLAPVVDNEISWYWPHYDAMAVMIKAVAHEQGLRVEWGGDWKTFRDGPHWQIPWNAGEATVAAKPEAAPEGTAPVVVASAAAAPVGKVKPGTLTTTGAKEITVDLPKMNRSWITGEYWLNMLGLVGTVALALGPVIEPQLDRIGESPWLLSLPLGPALYAFARQQYKSQRMKYAAEVAASLQAEPKA